MVKCIFAALDQKRLFEKGGVSYQGRNKFKFRLFDFFCLVFVLVNWLEFLKMLQLCRATF